MKNIIYLLLLSFACFGQELKLQDHQITSKKVFEGDLKNLTNGKIDDVVFAGWNQLAYPAEIHIDLESISSLDKVSFYDGAGTQKLTIQTSKTLNRNEVRKTVYSANTSKYNEWVDVPVKDQIRYVFLIMNDSKQQYPAEFKFTGTYGTIPASYTPVKLPQKLSKQSIGVCSGIWPDPNLISYAGNVRLWFQWEWVTSKVKGEYRFNNGDAAWKGKETLKRYNDLGIKPLICLQNAPVNILNGNGVHLIKGLPVAFGSNLEDAASYKDYIDACVAMVKEYGTSTRYEIMNEWDKTWQLSEGTETPYYATLNNIEYACFFQACYMAMKIANPDIEIAMGGMISPNWRSIALMSDYWRDNGFKGPDFINFHVYCTDTESQSIDPTKGVSPDDFKLYDKVSEFVSYCNYFLPGIPVICTEFGWDTNNSGFSPKVFTDKESTQGLWITQAYTQLAQSGVKTAYQYNLNDWSNVNIGNDKFNVSGLITSENTGYKPKKSYQIVKDFANSLTDLKPSLSRYDSLLIEITPILKKYTK